MMEASGNSLSNKWTGGDLAQMTGEWAMVVHQALTESPNLKNGVHVIFDCVRGNGWVRVLAHHIVYADQYGFYIMPGQVAIIVHIV
uniref:Uncharacterized protein n=1 Tax=Romanomermis culicivorax TaxID=13658 RepID=A0A915HHC1_ROMCU